MQHPVTYLLDHLLITALFFFRFFTRILMAERLALKNYKF